MALIKNCEITKIYDSRGTPTVCVDIYTTEAHGYGQAPSGASTGKYEVFAYPNNDIDLGIKRFKESVIPALLKNEFNTQSEFDNLLHELDGTKNFSNLGGNITTAASIAWAKTLSKIRKQSIYEYFVEEVKPQIPYPVGNVINGGRHAIGSTDIQEYLAIPLTRDARKAIEGNIAVHRKVGTLLKKKFPYEPLGRGDEGGWVAKLTNMEALDLFATVCREISDNMNIEIRPGLDLAASEFYRNGKYHYRERTLSQNEQIEFIVELIKKFNLFYVEDPLEQEDFEGYARLMDKIKDAGLKTNIVGDDIFVTNPERIQKGISMGACNAVLIKVNQIGTITDTLKAIKLARSANYNYIISHRSGETTDNFIAHLAVGTASLGIKTGVLGGERMAKLNELIKISERLSSSKSKNKKGE